MKKELNIYIGAHTSRKKGGYCWVLVYKEDGEKKASKGGFGFVGDATPAFIKLKCLSEALKNIRPRKGVTITIHVRNSYIKEGLEKLPKWEENKWRNVANVPYWKYIASVVKVTGAKIVVNKEDKATIWAYNMARKMVK